MKVFRVLYWTCKEEVAVVKKILFLSLTKKLGVTELWTLKLNCQGPFEK